MKHIVVFEDIEAKRIELIRRLKQRLRGKASVEWIDGEGAQVMDRTYESQLKEEMKKYPPGKALVICDKDLSGMIPKYPGLSASTVAAAVDEIGHHPICLYARGERQKGEEFLRSLAPWEKKRIILDFKGEEDLAADCVKIFKGFHKIDSSYSSLKKKRSTPAQALSEILGKPEIVDSIALYGSGEQGLLEDIMPFIKGLSGKKINEELGKRMPRILGNWLYTSILRFPGILVNEIAAASYLNIHLKDFTKPSIQKIFSSAKYKGPFAEMGQWWWRHELDDILINNECKDGFDLANKKRLRLKPCKDEQSNERAGFYCMVTEKPVSEKNSRGSISWFPSGADLTRIRKDKFNELAPWIGLY